MIYVYLALCAFTIITYFTGSSSWDPSRLVLVMSLAAANIVFPRADRLNDYINITLLPLALVIGDIWQWLILACTLSTLINQLIFLWGISRFDATLIFSLYFFFFYIVLQPNNPFEDAGLQLIFGFKWFLTAAFIALLWVFLLGVYIQYQWIVVVADAWHICKMSLLASPLFQTFEFSRPNYAPISDILAFSSEFLFIFGILILLVHLTLMNTRLTYLPLIEYSSKTTMYLLTLVSAALVYQYGTQYGLCTSFNASLINTSQIIGIKLIMMLFSIAIVHLSTQYFKDTQLGYFEYNILLCCSLVGCLFTVSANDFLMLYISLEVQALSLYVLTAIRKSNTTTEAGLKYFIIGSFSSALLLYGISTLVLCTGQYNFDQLQLLFVFNGPTSTAFFIRTAVCSILIALLIKLAVAPFHGWVASVYEGLLTPTAFFFAIVPKLAVFFVFVRLVFQTFASFFDVIQPLLATCCVTSLIVGPLCAFQQQKIKRFLAYSSVNHFGFILIGLITGTQTGLDASVYYFTIYMILTFGVWSALISMYTVRPSLQIFYVTRISELGGLQKTMLGAATLFVFNLLSMGGVPPLGGFTAKYNLFHALISNCNLFVNKYNFMEVLGWNVLLMITIFSSLLSIFYYLRLAKVILYKEPLNIVQNNAVWLNGLFMALNLLIWVAFINENI